MVSDSVAPVDEIERLNRMLDDIALGRPSAAGPDQSEAFTEVVRNLAGCRDAPAPDSLFVERLAMELQESEAMIASSTPGAMAVLPLSGSILVAPRQRIAGQLRRLTPLVELAAVAAVLLVLATGFFGQDALRSALSSLWQEDASPVSDAGDDVPMLGVDAARTGVQPGPGPVGDPSLVWQTYVHQVWNPPALADGTLFTSVAGGLVAIDARTGEERWTTRGLTNTQHSTAAVADGVVYVGGTRSTETLSQGPEEGAMYALDAATGTMLWQAPTGGSGGSSPAVVDGVVYITGGKAQPGEFDHLYAFDAVTGQERWRYEITGNGVGFAPFSPAVAGGVVFVGDGSGTLHAVDADTGQSPWTYRVSNANWLTTPVVADGLVLVSSERAEDLTEEPTGQLYAIEAETGSLQWTSPVAAPASPSVADGVAYVASRESDGHVVNAIELATGQEIWQTEIEGADHALPFGYTPAFVDGSLYVVSQQGGQGMYSVVGSLIALDAASGQIDWTVRLVGGIQSGVIVSDGIVYAGTTTGLLYAIGGVASADGVATAVPALDLNAIEPCTAESLPAPEIDMEAGAPMPGLFDPDHAVRLSEQQIPAGEAAPAETVDEIERTIDELERCLIAGDPARLYGFYSVDFIRRVRGFYWDDYPLESIVQVDGWRFSPFDEPRVVEARHLADGRVGVIVEASFDEREFVIFVRDGDRWRIDDHTGIMAPAGVATPIAGSPTGG